ncbi:MAG TPA: hybrid sensor histidine kinase/response regulator, partial [Planctomycetes bacterium]|nr:hybrid sensor histidine kinase/response regulator [Planctomycetota bacterium]
EDNPDMRNFLATALASKYNVLTAEDGKLGLSAARREHPDVILSDVQMPVMDGFAMLAELRKDHSFDRTPVLMLTAHSESSAMVESLELGAVDYIHKPFKLTEIEARIAAHLRTISMLEEIDERDSRLVAVGQIASTLAHDMRGPLTAIINRAELLRIMTEGGEKDELVDQEIAAIEQSVRRVNSMIQELLEFVSGREVVLEQSVTVVEDLVAPVAAESQMALQHSGIEWSFSMQGGENKLLVDRHRFSRIIENIINNARDALLSSNTASPKVSLHVSTDESHLILSISDNGPGIPQDVANSLFQPYATAGKAQGHGLGLAIVRNLVTANGGSVSLDSTVECGSSFIIKLPLL